MGLCGRGGMEAIRGDYGWPMGGAWPMGGLWVAHGWLMEGSRGTHGVHLGTHGMAGPWGANGGPMGNVGTHRCPWVLPGVPMGSPWVALRLIA